MVAEMMILNKAVDASINEDLLLDYEEDGKFHNGLKICFLIMRKMEISTMVTKQLQYIVSYQRAACTPE